MLNKIFSKKTTQILSGENNSDLALRLMFKIAISDGKLVSSELTLIKKRASSEIFKKSDWDDVISVNLTSVFCYCKAIGNLMINNGYGKIINIASMQSFLGGITIPAYAASKGGIAQLTKALSNDWAAKGLTVNAIAPGYMDTQLNTNLINDPKRNEEILSRIPKGRWGKPEDLVGCAIFLASEASDYVTGSIIPVDGGFLSR